MPLENKYPSDVSHFSNLPFPLAPNAEEVNIYKKYLSKCEKNSKNRSKCLLLGYTKGLFELCDEAMDIHFPNTLLENNPDKCIQADWFDPFETSYDIIIGDGVLNLVGGSLVEHLSHVCQTLVIRFFTEKIDAMKYATYFRHNTPCLLPDIVIPTQKSCVMYVWHFKPSVPR